MVRSSSFIDDLQEMLLAFLCVCIRKVMSGTSMAEYPIADSSPVNSSHGSPMCLHERDNEWHFNGRVPIAHQLFFPWLMALLCGNTSGTSMAK